MNSTVEGVETGDADEMIVMSVMSVMLMTDRYLPMSTMSISGVSLFQTDGPNAVRLDQCAFCAEFYAELDLNSTPTRSTVRYRPSLLT